MEYELYGRGPCCHTLKPSLSSVSDVYCKTRQSQLLWYTKCIYDIKYDNLLFDSDHCHEILVTAHIVRQKSDLDEKLSLLKYRI